MANLQYFDGMNLGHFGREFSEADIDEVLEALLEVLYERTNTMMKDPRHIWDAIGELNEENSFQVACLIQREARSYGSLRTGLYTVLLRSALEEMIAKGTDPEEGKLTPRLVSQLRWVVEHDIRHGKI